MSNAPEEIAFENGSKMLADGRYEEAVAFFKSAMQLGGERLTINRRMRCLSYYGLSVALADRPTPEAIKACEVAARRISYSAELQLNLGKIYMLAGKTTRALAAFDRGLHIAPGNRAIRTQIAGAERRGRQAIPWMKRSHPLNVFLGKARASLNRTRMPRRSGA